MTHKTVMSIISRGVWLQFGISLLCLSAFWGCATPETKCNSAPVESRLVHSLQRQLDERDRRLAELTSQFHALKLIDQDLEPRTKLIRPPATLTPAGTDQHP